MIFLVLFEKINISFIFFSAWRLHINSQLRRC